MKFTPWDNPMGTDGFEFIEYAAPDPAALGKLFEQLGFRATYDATVAALLATLTACPSTSSSTMRSVPVLRSPSSSVGGSTTRWSPTSASR